MIIKASQRGGGKQLGLHLMKTEDNEHVEIHEIRGFVSDEIVGALKESYAVSRGTKCKQFLFSVSLNPETESVSVDVFEDAANRIEQKNGLTGQPRVIVFHEKEGRRHAHVVWSRIDPETMTARNLNHFKLKLRDISKELYLENDWQMPRGLMDSQARDPRNYSLVEYQQAKRMGRDARDVKGMIQECWAVSDSRAAFTHALSERGLILAKGDRRGHVAVTAEGEVLSVARYTGKKAKAVSAKLGQPGDLPTVNAAKQQMGQDMDRAMNRHAAEARARFDREAAGLEAQRRKMVAMHTAERTKLDAAQADRWQRETRERQARFKKGMRGLWHKLTGRDSCVRGTNEREAYAALGRDRTQRANLVDAQLRERQELQVQVRHVRTKQAARLTEIRHDRQRYRQMVPSDGPLLSDRWLAALRRGPTPVPERTRGSASAAFGSAAQAQRQQTPRDRLSELRTVTRQPGPSAARSR